MAIDSAAKRYSMLAMSARPMTVLFIPDGTVAASDRAHMLHLYGGITLSGGATGRIMSSLASYGGLAGLGGLAKGGGLAG